MANPSPGFQRSPNHHIMLDVGTDAVTVTLNGAVVAASTSAVVLREDGYPARAYIPPADITAALVPTAKTTHCPFKGDTVYYDVKAGDETLTNAAWSYDAPYDEMAPITGYVSFDDRFTVAIG